MADQAVSKCTVPAFTPFLRANQDEIGKAAVAARKDNDFVYHERLPDARSLDTILAQPIARSLPVSFPLTPDFRGRKILVFVLFRQRILHRRRFICVTGAHCVEQRLGHVQFETSGDHEHRSQSTSRSDQRAERVSRSDLRWTITQPSLIRFLASLNLPAAIEDSGGRQIPASVAEKANAIKRLGGINTLDQMVNELPASLTRNKEILDEVRHRILSFLTSMFSSLSLGHPYAR